MCAHPFRFCVQALRVAERARKPSTILRRTHMKRPVTNHDIDQMGGMEYRLGDLLRGYFSKANATEVFCSHWPNTIGCEYAKHQRKDSDYELLTTLVRGGETPPNDSLVVHLRLGDVLDWPLYAKNYGCATTAGCRWVVPLAQYLKSLEHLCIPKPVRTVYIVGNPNYRTENRNGSMSKSYMTSVVEFFRKRNYTTLTRSNSSADDDLRFMRNAHYFLPGRGRFAGILGRMNEKITLRNYSCVHKQVGDTVSA